MAKDFEQYLRDTGYYGDSLPSDQTPIAPTDTTFTPAPPTASPNPASGQKPAVDQNIYKVPSAIDYDTASKLSDFQTLDPTTVETALQKGRRSRSDTKKGETVGATVPEFAAGAKNMWETFKEEFFIGNQVSAARISSMMFGAMSVDYRNMTIEEPGFRGAVQEGLAAYGQTLAPTELIPFAKYMRGLTMSWKDWSQEALLDARTSRDFDPDAVTSVLGSAGSSALSSMVIGGFWKGLLPLASTKQLTYLTTGTFGMQIGTQSYEQDIEEGATELEALSYSLLKGGATVFTEKLGVNWLFKEHKSTAYRVADAAFGRFFENIFSQTAYTTTDYLAANFEKTFRPLPDGSLGYEADTIYGKRTFKSFEEFNDFAKNLLFTSMLGSLMSGATSFAIGGPVNRFLSEGYRRAGLTREQANTFVDKMMAEAQLNMHSELALRAGIDYAVVSRNNRRIDALLGVEAPGAPDTSIQGVEGKGAQIPGVSDDVVLQGRMTKLRSDFEGLTEELAKIDKELVDMDSLDAEVAKRDRQRVEKRQNEVADKLSKVVQEHQAIMSGRAIYVDKPSAKVQGVDGETTKKQQLIDEGFVPITPDSQVYVPASVLMNVQAQAVVSAVRNYTQGKQDAKKALNHEGLVARRIMRDYVKGLPVNPKVKERLMRKLVGVKNGADLNRAVVAIAPLAVNAIDRAKVNGLKADIDGMMTRYRKDKKVGVDQKKVLDRILTLKKDQSIREDILKDVADNGIMPDEGLKALYHLMARYYSPGMVDTVAELTQVHRALTAFTNYGATEANRVAAERGIKLEQDVQRVIDAIDADKITPTEKQTGIRQSTVSSFFTLLRGVTLTEPNLMYNSIAKALVASGSEAEVIDAFEVLNTFGAELNQYHYEGMYKQRLQDAYKTAFDLKNKYDATSQMQRDSKNLPGDLRIPMFRPDGKIYAYLETTTPARARTIWQYWQNTKSQRALERAGYTQESIDFIETNILTPQDHAFMAETSRIMSEIYELVKPVYERLTNKPLGYEAFYLPLLSASDITASGDILPGASNMETMLKGGSIWGDPTFVAPASTKSKTGGGEVKIANDFSLVQKYARDMIHFATMGDKMNQLKSIFQDSRIREAVVKRYGQTRYDMFNKAIDGMMRNTARKRDDSGFGVFDKMVNHLAVGAITASGPKLGLMQLSSSTIAMVDVGVENFVRGIASFRAALQTGEINKLKEYSYYKYRGIDNFSIAMRLANEASSGIKGDLGLSNKYQDALTFFMRAGDKGGVLINTWVLYDVNKRNGMSDEMALKKAFEVTNTNQQSSFMSQMPMAAIEGDSFTKAFYKFTSTTNQYFNNMYVASAEYAGALRRSIRKGESPVDVAEALLVSPQAKKLARSFIMYHVVQPLLYGLVAGAGRIDPDEFKLLAVMGPFARLAFFGQLAHQSASLSLMAFSEVNEENPNWREFWRGYQKLNNDTIIVSWLKQVAKFQKLIAEVSVEDITWREAAELTDALGRTMTIAYPTGGAGLQWLGRAGQGTMDIMEDDYYSGLRRYMGYSTYAIDNSKPSDKNDDAMDVLKRFRSQTRKGLGGSAINKFRNSR
ncbi:MAG: hypothetical protein EOL91_04205 [Actinobacteria bacterium]|nr:hypothetical protein [Actinomycetota bacterium]